MLSLFKRKKVREDQISLSFAIQFLETVDRGFPEVSALINESPEFERCPEIAKDDSDRFLLIALSANLLAVQRSFTSNYDQIIIRKILEHMSELCDVDYGALVSATVKCEKFISKVNHPSKNLVYGMSKAVFHKYDLNQFQEEYFRNVNSPNPVFLKRLDEALVYFLRDWEEWGDK